MGELWQTWRCGHWFTMEGLQQSHVKNIMTVGTGWEK